MMYAKELINDHLMVCAGDFTQTIDATNATKVTGMVTESEPGLFQFALVIHNIGIGVAFKL